MKRSLFNTKQEQNYKTPKKIIIDLEKEFGFLYDPCPLNNDITKYDGLKTNWFSPVFCNPPYNNISEWVKKIVEQYNKGVKPIILLCFVRTDTKYFHDLIMPCKPELRFIKGRLKFNNLNSAPFPSMLVIFK